MAPPKLSLEDPRQLQPHPRNPRQGDIGAIVESIRGTGWHGVVVGQASTRQVVAGWHRARAAAFIIDLIEKGDEEWTTWATDPRTAHLIDHGVIPVEWQDLDNDEAVRKLLADNRTNDLATYDSAALADLLIEMGGTPTQFMGTGWQANDVDDLVAQLHEPPLALEELAKKVGPSTPEDFAAAIKLNVPPELYERWRRIVDDAEGNVVRAFQLVVDAYEATDA